MADLHLVAAPGSIAAAVAAKKTLYQLIAPANQRVKILGWGVSFDSASTTAVPVNCTLEFQTTAIGGTPTATNPKKTDSDAPATVQSTGFVYGGSPTEPTAGDVIDQRFQHPQFGFYVPCPRPGAWVCGAGDRVAITVNAPAAVNAIPVLHVEE